MYNVSSDLNSNVLQPFELYLRKTPNNKDIFQNLVILVRDWKKNNNFGFQGGKEYLLYKLNNETKDTYKYLNMYLNSIDCYLWPSPGKIVCDNEYNGCLSKLKASFVEHLTKFIPITIEKLISGSYLKGSTLSQHIKDCFHSIQEKKPLPSIVEANVNIDLITLSNSIKNQAILQFINFIDSIESNKSKCDLEKLKELEEESKTIKSEALNEFEKLSEKHETIYQLRYQELDKTIETGLNDKEIPYLAVLCYENIRKLKMNNGKELDNFINTGFLGYLFTRKSKIEEKSEELKKMVEEELKKYPALQNL